MSEAKSFAIPKQQVWEAYRRVKANSGAAGVDKQSLTSFEEDLEGNLYKVWNRMSSGCYFPAAVRLVEIPKSDGGIRRLGIPTVADRVAQTVAKMEMEPVLEPVFHPDSYGYRPGRSALDAVGVARKRCWDSDWVIDLDIKAFFDSISHELIERAVAHHTKNPWIQLYVGRWLRVPMEKPDGTQEARTKGTPQGGVISPLLANLFLHYAFDAWMQREYPAIRFERYADDAIVHCNSQDQAEAVLEAIRHRLRECGLELHPEKTRIVYCKDSNRRREYEHIKFDFLGFTFQPRRAKDRWERFFVGFLPAISGKSAKHIRQTIREWQIATTRSNQPLEAMARLTDATVRGWMNYYGRFYRSKCVQVLRYLNLVLAKWVRWKLKGLRCHKRESMHWLGRVAKREPNLFALWQLGIRPAAGE